MHKHIKKFCHRYGSEYCVLGILKQEKKFKAKQIINVNMLPSVEITLLFSHLSQMCLL